jgi:hypothetical protein
MFIASALALGLGASAQAEETKPRHLKTGIGLSASIGGGAVGFADTTSNDVIDPGAAWTTRLVIGTRLPIAAEVAYVGAAQGMNALGMDDDAILLSNGVETALRWNLLSTFRGSSTVFGRFDPYLFAGIGYRRYSIENTEFNTSSLADVDNVGEVPAGIGLAWMNKGVVLDMRGEYRFAFSDELFTNTDLGQDTWGVSLRIGMEF